ncbi:unnamed protein product [Clonostachys chloroleuca]|uniref:Major facilitator superfamily (MFS) profile domain-containing protein n=1 Tax=Clonostachys chloroleuca TaxID=1926264 RepID=A0AA35LZB0_9HYPO|nr:unnamed protein product [Clonostachys chloroleuca]
MASNQDPKNLSRLEMGVPQPTEQSRTVLRTWQRNVILFIVSWNCLVVTSTSTSLLIATPEIASDLSTTPEILNAGNAGLLIAMGCSALFWSPLAELTSRRISYNLAMLVLLGASIGTALAKDLGTFTAMRLLSGLEGTFFMVAGQTIIADIFKPTVRGRAVGCQMVGAVAGTAIGPCIGGIILTYSNWRSIYWLQVAQAGLGFVLSLAFIPHIRSETQQLYEKNGDTKISVLRVWQSFNPIRIFKLYFRPQVLLADLTCGFLAITQYALLTSVRHIINPRFNLTTPLVSGLFYIAPGAGFIVGSLVGGRISDHTVKQWIAKRDGLRLPKDRLNSSLVHLFIVLPISMLLFGWSLEKNIGGLALPIVMAFWIGVGLMGAFNGLNTYTAEVFPDQRAEVVSSKYVLQYVFGASATGAVVPLLNSIGVGWSFTFFTFFKILGGVLLLVVARFAPDTGVWAHDSQEASS